MATILRHLEALFIQHIEPVRPDRKYTHQRITVKARSKYRSYRDQLKHF